MFRTTPFRNLRCGKARATLNVPLRSMSTTVPIPFGERFSAKQKKFPAAPLTTMSRRPNACAVCATTASMAAGSRTSPARASACAPARCISAAVGSRCSCLRLEIATLQPADANASAMPRQMPVPPPVTRAALPFRRSGWNGLMGPLSDGFYLFDFARLERTVRKW